MKNESNKKYKYIPIEDVSKLQVGDILYSIADKLERKILFIYDNQMTLSKSKDFNSINTNTPWYTYNNIKPQFYQRIECPIEYVDYTTALKALHEDKRVKSKHSELIYRYNKVGVLVYIDIYSDITNSVVTVSAGLNIKDQYEILDD